MIKSSSYASLMTLHMLIIDLQKKKKTTQASLHALHTLRPKLTATEHFDRGLEID